MARHIAYYRVSTARQGQSGLGLEAQRKAVADFLKGGGLVAEFTEVESGKRADRVELAKALTACRKHKAVLVIAKLDRLSRNVAFIANLMEAGVEFVACDMPYANKLTLHILAAMAEHEREMISKRTREALAAAKARGRKLGWSIPDRAQDQREAAAKGATTTATKADQFAANVLPIVRDVQRAGIKSLAGIASALNARGVRTAQSTDKAPGTWYPTTVKNLLARAAA